ncbi:MAG: hypothetical protein H0W65_03415 [Sphingomonas sp.]|uniref:hypothetical protein n=1 Tax=Sphingomonas sp. TaxID=28214 RepID=UPI0017F99352|nr:hypothetical protein [Sphingomonas sp.]MBA3666757.1 hypothetical protein [Sphingomonas sp.]
MLTLALLVAAQALSDEVSRAVRQQEGCGLRAKTDEVVVCGRRNPVERYRLPGRDGPFDPAGNAESVMRERARWAEGGEAGTQSCGPVGPGGWTGCLVRQWAREREQAQ